jgi:hypothetical protein
MRAVVEIQETMELLNGDLDERCREWIERWKGRDVTLTRWQSMTQFVREYRIEGDDEAVRDFLALVMPYARSV